MIWLLLLLVGQGPGAQPGAAAPVARLGQLITSLQRGSIRESYGESAADCFTWIDLDHFRRSGRAKAVARGVQDSPEVRAVVAHFRGHPIHEVETALAPLRRPARPTWAQMGRISREGQTEAGNRAEREIADAVVEMVLGLLSPTPR